MCYKFQNRSRESFKSAGKCLSIQNGCVLTVVKPSSNHLEKIRDFQNAWFPFDKATPNRVCPRTNKKTETREARPPILALFEWLCDRYSSQAASDTPVIPWHPLVFPTLVFPLKKISKQEALGETRLASSWRWQIYRPQGWPARESI